MNQQNLTAIIPGASRPIGRAIAEIFGDAGYELFLPYFDWPESVLQMKQDFTKKGYVFTAAKVDLRIKKEVKKFVKKIEKQTSHVNILINNIERGGMPIVHGSYNHKHNHDQWDRELETTLKAKHLLYNHCKKLLLSSQDASVLNISSIAADIGRSGPAALFFSDGYSAANRAISTLTKNWASELAPDVRVNELMLGLIDSRHGQGTRGWETMSKAEKQSVKNHILLKRTGLPEEVAETVYFLTTQASYLTGAVITMDGGYSLGGEQVPDLPPGIL